MFHWQRNPSNSSQKNDQSRSRSPRILQKPRKLCQKNQKSSSEFIGVTDKKQIGSKMTRHTRSEMSSLYYSSVIAKGKLMNCGGTGSCGTCICRDY